VFVLSKALFKKMDASKNLPVEGPM
jgi:hypothetical protein